MNFVEAYKISQWRSVFYPKTTECAFKVTAFIMHPKLGFLFFSFLFFTFSQLADVESWKKHKNTLNVCQNFKNALQLLELKTVRSPSSTLCVTVLNSNTADNEAWHFIAGKMPGLQTKTTTTTAHLSPPSPPSSSPLCPLISVSHSNIVVFFSKIPEKTFTRDGARDAAF